MSCLAPGYNPNPTREWYRVQNACTFVNNNSSTSNYTYIPQLKKYVPNADVFNELNMLRKGNILQYKNNRLIINNKMPVIISAPGNVNIKKILSYFNYNIKYKEMSLISYAYRNTR